MVIPAALRPDAHVGYRWYTIGADRERPALSMWGWLKVGPVTFTWGDYIDGTRHLECCVLNRWPRVLLVW